MTALEKLRQLNSSPAISAVNSRINSLKRAVRPVAPIVTRALISSTFIEDSIRTLGELPSQQLFFKHALGVPNWLSKAIIIPAVIVTLISATLFLVPKTHTKGAKLLLACVAYQQIIYGRHSALTTGNFGFFIRNLCMAGTLALFLAVRGGKDSRSSPTGGDMRLPGGGSASARLKRGAKDNAALLVRVLFAIACFEMYDVVGWWWALLIIPGSVALVFGYQAELCALMLMAFYGVGAIIANPFWTVRVLDAESAHMRMLMRYEFLQTVSILGGLMLIIFTGPGAFSVDNKISQGKAW